MKRKMLLVMAVCIVLSACASYETTMAPVDDTREESAPTHSAEEQNEAEVDEISETDTPTQEPTDNKEKEPESSDEPQKKSEEELAKEIEESLKAYEEEKALIEEEYINATVENIKATFQEMLPDHNSVYADKDTITIDTWYDKSNGKVLESTKDTMQDLSEKMYSSSFPSDSLKSKWHLKLNLLSGEGSSDVLLSYLDGKCIYDASETKDSGDSAEIDASSDDPAMNLYLSALEIILSGYYKDHYKIDYDGGNMIMVSVWDEGIALSARLQTSKGNYTEWNTLKDGLQSMSNNFYEAFADAGIEGKHVTVSLINDLNRDNSLLMFLDGVCIYDFFEVNQ